MERIKIMAKKKISKSNKIRTKRLILLGIICLAINFYVFYSVANVLKQVYDKKREKTELSEKLVNLQEEEETLKVQVNKLKDPDYIAKYAREKFFYSKKGEYIIRIE